MPTPTQRFKTGPQIVVGSAENGKAKLQTKSKASKQKLYAAMLVDPTIALGVGVIAAMLQRQPWAVEGDNKEQCEFVLKALEKYRKTIIRSAFRGLLLDGWRSFEVLFGLDEQVGWYNFEGVKPLKGTLTSPVVFEDTGAFAGVLNKAAEGNDEEIFIDEQHVIFVNYDDDGFGELGVPQLDVVEGPFRAWEECDRGAKRYDQKVAGGFLLIQYPVGETEYSRNGGAKTDNAEIMVDLANSFEAAGYGGVPVNVDPETGKKEDGPWSVEHISAGGGLQPNFVVRAKYLDALKLRAFGIPERSTTEGTFGTKAEAEQHADIAITINLDRHQTIIDAVNQGPIKAMCEANWGDPYACKLVLGKLDPNDRELFGSIFSALMGDPLLGEHIAQAIDIAELLTKLSVPIKPGAMLDNIQAEVEQQQLLQQQQQQLLQQPAEDPNANPSPAQTNV